MAAAGLRSQGSNFGRLGHLASIDRLHTYLSPYLAPGAVAGARGPPLSTRVSSIVPTIPIARW